MFGSVGRVILRLAAASPAEAVIAVPLNELPGSTRKIKQGRVHPAEPRAQINQRLSRSSRAGSIDGKTRASPETTEENFGFALDIHPTKLVRLDGTRYATFVHTQDVVVDEHEIPSVIQRMMGFRFDERLEVVWIYWPHRCNYPQPTAHLP